MTVEMMGWDEMVKMFIIGSKDVRDWGGWLWRDFAHVGETPTWIMNEASNRRSAVVQNAKG